MKTEIADKDTYEIHFDSAMDILDERPSTSDNERLDRRAMRAGGDAWTRTKDYDTFRQIINGGASAFMADVMAKADQITVPFELSQSLINVTKRRRVRRDSGDELDFDAWRRGDIDTAWETTQRVLVEAHRTRAACVFINLVANSNITPYQMEWRTAAVIKVVEALTAANWALEIVVGATCHGAYRNGPKRLAITFTAKPSNMPLSIERLALQSSAAWFRYCVFKAMAANAKRFDLTEYYGRASYSERPDYINRMAERGYRIIEVPATAMSAIGAQAAVTATLKEVM